MAQARSASELKQNDVNLVVQPNNNSFYEGLKCAHILFLNCLYMYIVDHRSYTRTRDAACAGQTLNNL